MSAMRWFRKHNKKIMVIAGCILMVAFLLPAAFFRASGKNPAEQVRAHFNNSDGKQIEITQGMLEAAENELKALQMLGISEIQIYQLLQKGNLPTWPGLFGVGAGPVLATHLLLFSSQNTDPRSTSLNLRCRDIFTAQAEYSDWAEDEETLNFLKESIQRLTGVEAQDAAYYYLLLAYEAQQMGIHTTTDAVEKLLELRHWQNKKIADIVNQCNLQETGQLKKAVANYVAIVRYCDLITKTLVISEPQLKKNIRDNIQKENVSGTFVTFRGFHFRNQAGEPKPEELQEQFEHYKACEPEKVTEENPHGFGYRLPDRVKIEFLMIELAQVQKGIENKFAQKDILERKKLEQSYWDQDKKAGYVYQYKASQNKLDDASQESPSDNPQDERNARLQWERNKVWQKREALQTAMDLLNKAKDNSQKILTIADLKQILPDQRASRAADYPDLAKQLKKNSGPNDPNIPYNPNYDGFYFSKQELFRLWGLSSAEFRRPNQPSRPIADTLFQCQPLHKGILTRLDETPVELYEDIGPLQAGPPGSEWAVYLVRIVGADPSRPSDSIYDDGSLGPAPDSLDPNENNPLFQRVKRDWQTLKEFSLAVDEANRFAELTDPNWAGAVAKVNEEHNRDPNLPGPLQENSLDNSEQQIEKLIQQMTRLQETMQNNPQLARYFQSELQNKQQQIIEIDQLRQKAMELAQERADKNDEGRAVLDREDKLSCLVFKDLKLAPASQQEYLRRKPMKTRDTIRVEQEMLAVIHLTPGNIEKRSGFQRKTNEGE